MRCPIKSCPWRYNQNKHLYPVPQYTGTSSFYGYSTIFLPGWCAKMNQVHHHKREGGLVGMWIVTWYCDTLRTGHGDMTHSSEL